MFYVPIEPFSQSQVQVSHYDLQWIITNFMFKDGIHGCWLHECVGSRTAANLCKNVKGTLSYAFLEKTPEAARFFPSDAYAL